MRHRLSFVLAVCSAALVSVGGAAHAVAPTYSGTVEGVCTDGQPSILATNTGTGDIVAFAGNQQQLIPAGSDPEVLAWPIVQETLVPDVQWSLLRIDTEQEFDSGTLVLDEVCPPEQETTTTEPAPTTTQETTTTQPTTTAAPTTAAPTTAAPTTATPTSGVDVNATLPSTGPDPTTTRWLVVIAGAMLLAGGAMRLVRRPTG